MTSDHSHQHQDRRPRSTTLGDRVSVLERTDPELWDYLTAFALVETRADADRLDETLPRSTKRLVQLAAVLAAGGLGRFREIAHAALTDGDVTPTELKELVYQAVAYVGMARTIDYLDAVNELLADAGVELPLPSRSTTTPRTRLDRGLAVQKHIVGAQRVESMHANAPEDQKHIQRYLSANCFGDTVARRGLDLPTRELLTFSMLVAVGGADAQVRGHVTGNLNVGNTRRRLVAVLTLLVPDIGYPRTLNGLAAVDDVTADS